MKVVTYRKDDGCYIPNDCLSVAYVYTVDHPDTSNQKLVRTSTVKSVDHVRGIFVTQNSIYVPEGYAACYENNFQAIVSSLVYMLNQAYGMKMINDCRETLFSYLKSIEQLEDGLEYCLLKDVRGFVIAITVIDDEHQIKKVVWELSDEEF